MSFEIIHTLRRGLLVIAVLLLGGQLMAQSPHYGYRPEELICKMNPGYDISIINDEYGTVVKGHQTDVDCYLLATPTGQNAESLAVIINARPEVEFCEVNHLLAAPEPFQRSQPFIDIEVVGDIFQQASALTLDLTTAQTIADGTGTKVALIDGGIDFDHPFFAGQPGSIISGWDYVDGDDFAFDEPGGACSGHGTFVASILSLTAPGIEIYSYRALDTSGEGSAYDISEAILKALDDGCRVINLSLGMTGIDHMIDDALRVAEQSNVLIVAAAGNDSTNLGIEFPFPAGRNNCIAVAAVDSLNLKADFSNYGAKVDLCAPGTQIYGSYVDDMYAWWNGTSFSTPFVTGMAALMWSLNPDLNRHDVFDIMGETAIRLDDLNLEYENLLGAGLIDIVAGLNAVSGIEIGDVNDDGVIDLIDILDLIDFIYEDGANPSTITAADLDQNRELNLLDVLALIDVVY